MSVPCGIDIQTIFHGRARNECWFEPSAALVPRQGETAVPWVIVTASQLVGNDVGPHHYTWSRDLGQTWSNPAESQSLQVNALGSDVFEKPWLAPFYHRASDTLLMIGRTCFTQDTSPTPGVKGESHALWSARAAGMNLQGDLIYSRWDAAGDDFVPWQRLRWQEMWAGEDVSSLYTSDVCQRLEEADGTILSPVTVPDGERRGRAAVMRLRWDGASVEAVERGNILACSDERGFHEPSLVHSDGRYLLTLRNDLRAYVAQATDGLHFSEPAPWCFDDGQELGSYNTQQHWLQHGDALFLVYTRRSDLGNGVVRHRAPLFMAEVDVSGPCIIRDTERVVIPEKGARMGNFCTLEVAPDEAWVITGEWLQQLVEGHEEGMPFYADAARGAAPYNRIQYIGDLLLARIRS